MGFHDARQRLVDALKRGHFDHEAREALKEKNLLAVGKVDAQFVIRLLHRCRGAEYRESHHDFDSSIMVHTFIPMFGDDRWYVKAYLLPDEAMFISVHISKSGGR